jgi:RNA-directed DNA polymerase
MASVEQFLARRLKLKVNAAKSAVARPEHRKFLGFSFTTGKQPRRRIAPQALARFKSRVRELTRRTRGREPRADRRRPVALSHRLARLLRLR